MGSDLHPKSQVCKKAAFIDGPRTAFLDHLLPLCDLFSAPLFVTDPWVYLWGKRYYPQHLEIFLLDHENLPKMLDEYQLLFVCEPCRLYPGCLKLGEKLYKKEIKTAACFHGISDKYLNTFWLERYADEDILLFNGRFHEDIFKEKNLFSRIKKTLCIGNLRYFFYKKYQEFFQSFISLEEGKKTIIYAPTWSFKGEEDDGFFFNHYQDLLEHLPGDSQIIIKPHPFLFRLFPDKLKRIQEFANSHENVLFLEETPLIFPWLAKADIYLGDYSSVGYDFLVFDKPLYFLKKRPSLIGKCGIKINSVKEVFYQNEDKQSLRKNFYSYIYEENICHEQLKNYLES